MKKHSNIFIEYLGWCGVLAIVASYALYFLGKLTADNIWFQILNLAGGLSVAAVSLYRKVWQTVVLGVFWAGLAVYALYVYLQ